MSVSIRKIILTTFVSSFMTATVFAATTTDTVNLRMEPSTSSKSLGIVGKGHNVDFVENAGEWSKVSFEGNTGYIRNDYLEGSDIVSYIYTTDNVNLREGVGTDTASLAVIPKGSKLNLESKGDTWSKVSYDGLTGFIRNDFLSIDGSATPITYLYTTSNVNLRDGASTNNNILKTLDENTTVELIEDNGDWAKVKSEDEIGYIRKDYLGNIVEKEKEAVTTANVNLREDSSTDSNIITTISSDTPVEIIESNDNFDKVSVDGNVGYISNDYLDNQIEYVDGFPVIVEDDQVPLASGTTASVNTTNGEVEDLSWQEIKDGNLFPVGEDAKVTDLYTGKVYYVRSFSNGNHADVEPVTEKDTQILKSTFGGEWSWDVRPVLVSINGHNFAGSINGQPHGGGVNSQNGMDGQVCIHFRGSTVHNGNENFAALHQKVAREALELAQ